MAHKLSEFLYQEIFLIGPGDTVSTKSEEIEVFRTFEELVTHMKTLSISEDEDVRVLHGYLTPADVLPPKMKNKNVFIITTDEDDESEGAITELKSNINVQTLAREIKDLVNEGYGLTFTTNIDCAFILYGYEINKVLAPDDEDLDEEVIQTCKKISEDVEKIRSRNEEQLERSKNLKTDEDDIPEVRYDD
jgi:translation elongation factor EF-1beta